MPWKQETGRRNATAVEGLDIDGDERATGRRALHKIAQRREP
jgi:hypothetical protein